VCHISGLIVMQRFCFINCANSERYRRNDFELTIGLYEVSNGNLYRPTLIRLADVQYKQKPPNIMYLNYIVICYSKCQQNHTRALT